MVGYHREGTRDTVRYVPITTSERREVVPARPGQNLHTSLNVSVEATEFYTGLGIFTMHLFFRDTDGHLHEFRALTALPTLWEHFELARGIDSAPPHCSSAWFGSRELVFYKKGARHTLEFSSWSREWSAT